MAKRKKSVVNNTTKNPEKVMILLFPLITLGVFTSIIMGLWLLNTLAPDFNIIPAL